MPHLDLAIGGSLPDRASGRQVSVWRDEAGEVCARLFTNGTTRWIDWPGLGLFAFEPGARSVHVSPAPGASPNVIANTFARVLRPAILQALGWQTMHASAVVAEAGVLAFCGLKHSGKSTLAYALSRAGCPQFADDALVMRTRDEGVIAHALPFSARLRPSSQAHFGGTAASGERMRMPLSVTAPLAAFFVLRQEVGLDGPPRLVRIQPARAFSELLTHAHCFDPADPDETRRLVTDYLETANRVPVFALTYRPGLEGLAEMVELVLRSIVADAGTPVAALS